MHENLDFVLLPNTAGLDHLLRQCQPNGLEAHAHEQQQEALDHEMCLSIRRDGDAHTNRKDIQEQDPAEMLSAKCYSSDKNSYWHA